MTTASGLRGAPTNTGPPSGSCTRFNVAANPVRLLVDLLALSAVMGRDVASDPWSLGRLPVRRLAQLTSVGASIFLGALPVRRPAGEGARYRPRRRRRPERQCIVHVDRGCGHRADPRRQRRPPELPAALRALVRSVPDQRPGSAPAAAAPTRSAPCMPPSVGRVPAGCESWMPTCRPRSTASINIRGLTLRAK